MIDRLRRRFFKDSIFPGNEALLRRPLPGQLRLYFRTSESDMDGDLEQLFEDEDEDIENQFLKGSEPTKEQVVYLVDASPKMLPRLTESGGDGEDSHFSFVVGCIAQALKASIINSSYDEAAICFFNTREQNNLQNSNSVYVFNVSDPENLDRPTARLIKEFSHIEETFMKSIGSQCGIISDTLDNSLFNALWVARAPLRKGSSKNFDKRILLFTNEDDPFSNIRGTAKADMKRMTIQRAKDAQDFGISIELLPLSRADEPCTFILFVKCFYKFFVEFLFLFCLYLRAQGLFCDKF